MPTSKPIPELPAEQQILAAIERAEIHHAREGQGVLLGTLIEHLHLPRGSATSRRLRPKLDALEEAGSVERATKYGSTVWTLTSNGRQWLDTLRQAGEVRALPEAPQHQRWRSAHEAARARIAGFREELRTLLREATVLLDTDEGGTATAWFALSERLHYESWRLASATYCLREWTEPDDAYADIDTPGYGQLGRREPQRWERQ